MAPDRALARRLAADARIRTGSFALFFAFLAYAIVVGYRDAYPTLADRIVFARSFGLNKAVQLFYGMPHNLLTVGGYAGWRLAGFGCVVAAVWAQMTAVRALRGEEDSGRQELVLACAVTRRGAFLAAVAAIAVGAFVLWAATFLALVAGRLPPAGSAYLALATMSAVPVFAGVGSLASQIAPTKRLALGLSTGVLAAAFLIRIVADIGGVPALRWVTPFGWTEELRPFADPRPAVLLLPLAATLALFVGAEALSRGRDVGSGLLHATDAAPPRLTLLSSTTAQALRGQLGAMAAWLAGTGIFAVVVGVLSTSFTKENISESIQKELDRLGGASLITPAGALGFYFVFFVLATSLFACSQVGAARREEAGQQLETTLALPVGRAGWLAGRLVLAAAGVVVLGLAAGALAWAGAAAQGAGVSLPSLLEAGLNCAPTAVLFLGLGTLAYALVPHAGTAIAYGLVTLAFVWDLLGSLLGAPSWLVQLTPFEHVGLVPAGPFRWEAALMMLAIGAGASAAALAAFRRRDLQES
jgi:ABC-2 type transport system permease protein